MNESQGRNSGTVGANVEAMEECWLLACSACFFLKKQDYQPRSDIAHSQLGLPISIVNLENAPQICSKATFSIFPIEVPASKIILAFVNLT